MEPKLTNILQYLENSAVRFPEKTAFSDGESALTFKSLSSYAASIGSFLHNIGIYRQP